MLRVSDLSVEFVTKQGTVYAVNDVNFEVPKGSIVGIVGETGSGKSTLLRSIIRLVRSPGNIVKGSVFLDDRDLMSLSTKELRAVRGSRIGFIGQNPFGALNPVLSIETQFRNVIKAHGRTSRKAARETALEQLRAVGIAGPERVLDGYPHELSGGMVQRVVIALALILGADLLLADEPTTSLDVTVQRQILNLIRDLVLSDGSSMLLVTHDLGVVAQHCETVLVMYAGKIVETGPVNVVFSQPAHPYTVGLLQSVPDPQKQSAGIPGVPPRPLDYPQGCPFRFRCAFAFDRCQEEPPTLRSIAPFREVSCHLDISEEEFQAAAIKPS